MRDKFKNFAVAELTSKPSDVDTTATLASGDEIWLPDLPAKMIMWDKGTQPDTILARRAGIAEIVDVTDETAGTIIFTRESGNAVDFSTATQVWIGQAWLVEHIESLLKMEVASNGDYITRGAIAYCDTTGGPMAVNSPQNPSQGDKFTIAEVGFSWGTNNLTVNFAENLSNGDGTFVCDNSDENGFVNAKYTFVFNGTNWEVTV